MTDLFNANLPIILVAVLIGAIVGFLIFRPRQRVTLNERTPLRPHMTNAATGEGRGLSDEAAAATSDVAGQMIGTRVHDELPGAGADADDLQRLKGVGPRFAAILHQQGIDRYDQIARLTEGDVERIDASLGAFRGRLTRDRIVAQADYLSRGDTDGYEREFGKL